jgi:hypothetical protein
LGANGNTISIAVLHEEIAGPGNAQSNHGVVRQRSQPDWWDFVGEVHNTAKRVSSKTNKDAVRHSTDAVSPTCVAVPPDTGISRATESVGGRILEPSDDRRSVRQDFASVSGKEQIWFQPSHRTREKDCSAIVVHGDSLASAVLCVVHGRADSETASVKRKNNSCTKEYIFFVGRRNTEFQAYTGKRAWRVCAWGRPPGERIEQTRCERE